MKKLLLTLSMLLIAGTAIAQYVRLTPPYTPTLQNINKRLSKAILNQPLAELINIRAQLRTLRQNANQQQKKDIDKRIRQIYMERLNRGNFGGAVIKTQN